VFDFSGKKIEVMKEELARSYDFINGLKEDHRKQVVVSDERMRLVAAAGRDGRVPEPIGVKATALESADILRLLLVVEAYVGVMPKPYAQRRLGSLLDEMNEMTVAWGGPTAPGSDMSYRIQSPSLLIEYAGQDLGRDPLDHIHGMYRDPSNEYGAGFDK